MAITRIQGQVTTSSGTTVTSLAATLAGAPTAGNLLLAAVMVANNATAITPPTGWTQAVINQPGTGASIEVAWFWRVAQAGDGTSYTFTLSAAHTLVIALSEWHATNGWPASPLDQTAVGDTVGTPTQSTTIQSGTTATTAQAEELWIGGLAYKGALQTETGITAGWTKDADAASGTANALSTLYQVAAATGMASVSYTIGTARYWAGAVITLMPRTATGASLAGTSQGDASGSVATLTTPSHTAPPPPVAQPPLAAQYTIRVRNPDKLAAGQVVAFRKMSVVKRFNNISDWLIEFDADDPVAILLTQPGYGISITRTVYNAQTGKVVNSRVEMAGPTTGIVRAMSGNTLTVHGKDDLLYLAGYTAWPVTAYQFSGLVTGLGSGLKLYWRMDAASGTTETDRSGNGNTGTYSVVSTGSYTLNRPGLIDDPDTAVAFNGTAGTAGALLTQGAKTPATLSGPFTFFCVVSNGFTGHICGSRAPNDNSFDVALFGTTIHADIGTGTAWISTGADATNVTWPLAPFPYVIAYVVTATGYTIYLNGTQVGSGTYASSTPLVWDANHTFRVGHSGTSGDTYAIGTIDELFLYSGALTLAQIQNLTNEALSRFGTGAQDAVTNVAAETALKYYVAGNCGPTAGFSERVIPNFAVEADTHQGATLSAVGRFDRLIAVDGTGLLQHIAQVGGVGFNVSTVAGVMNFHVYTPVDHTANIVFNEDLGNLQDFTYTREAPDPQTGGNVQIVAGGGDGVQRVIRIYTDPTSINNWWRYEIFLDARDTSDPTIMAQRGQAALDESAEVDTFDATLTPETLQMVYGVDFDLGDQVTAIVDGITYTDIVREVDITLDGGASEVVTPKMGTPNAVLVRDAMMKYIRIARRADSATGRLKTAQ